MRYDGDAYCMLQCISMAAFDRFHQCHHKHTRPGSACKWLEFYAPEYKKKCSEINFVDCFRVHAVALTVYDFVAQIEFVWFDSQILSQMESECWWYNLICHKIRWGAPCTHTTFWQSNKYIPYFALKNQLVAKIRFFSRVCSQDKNEPQNE